MGAFAARQILNGTISRRISRITASTAQVKWSMSVLISEFGKDEWGNALERRQKRRSGILPHQ